MLTVEELTERILYRLSLEAHARELASRVLARLGKLIGDLPASADYHHRDSGGLYQHSLEVALKMLEEFEGNIIMEHKPDGSVDSFRSARNRPRWQYATFLAALCHDLGKVFDMEVWSGERRWCALETSYQEFARQSRETPRITWRQDRERGTHALLSCVLLPYLLNAEDFDYLGVRRFTHVIESLAEGHPRDRASPLARILSKLDQASVEEAHVALAKKPDTKVGLFVQTLQELIANGELGVNFIGGQVYAMADQTAVVVPVSVNLAREHLKPRKTALPENTHLYDMLRNSHLVEADSAGRSVRKIRVIGRHGDISLSALIFPTERLVPRELFETLPPTQFEIEQEPQPASEPEEHHVG